MRRIPPSVRMRDEVDGLLRGGEAGVHPMTGFVRGLAQYILQVHIEAEATEFLGRGHYRRGERARGGWRNDYEGKGIQTEAGLLRLEVPQLRATEQPFSSPLMKRLGNRTADLEEMVRGMYVRGLSTMDVEGLYGDTFGESRLSKSTVSRITGRLNEDFDTWRKRDLSSMKVVYLFLDGQYHATRQGTTQKEGVLSAYALLESGEPVLLHLELGATESYDAWLAFLQNMTTRGLSDPLMVTFDGSPGLKKAIRRMWPKVFRQRCQAHKMLNILSKLPKTMQSQMKKLIRQVFWAPSYEEGIKRVHSSRVSAIVTRRPMECLEKDLEECVTYLRFPGEHHKRIPTTNRLERLNGEGRRRKKVIPRFPTERSCLSLLFATLITASSRWRGVPMTPAILRKLDQLRSLTPPVPTTEEVAA